MHKGKPSTLPDNRPRPERELTEADKAALTRAAEKRARKAEKRRKEKR